ncbi:MAG: hypothetical protein J3K34DRAFT_447538 [Monoraphidium minutum]|nr:MAG: hypothetical protein J3K34DRAFT_447538 [Monoraphidium minutum]
MTALSALPPACWAAWLVAAWTERDDGMRAVYVAYAILYAAPLLHYTGGFGSDSLGPAAAAVWAACAVHVQMHRMLRTNRVL